jgi:acyl-CoA dehydrogenase
MHQPGKTDTSLLYHVASAVALDGKAGAATRCAATRRLLLSRMVVDRRLQASDPFRLTENPAQRAITGRLLGASACPWRRLANCFRRRRL